MLLKHTACVTRGTAMRAPTSAMGSGNGFFGGSQGLGYSFRLNGNALPFGSPGSATGPRWHYLNQ